MPQNEYVTGGCACREIRYQFTGEPVLALNCHCRECQYASGNGYSAVVCVPTDAFELRKGEPHYYTMDANSDMALRRGFCANCGSPLMWLRPARPKIVIVMAATLDDPALHKPTMNIFTSEAHHWDAMDAALKKHPAMPPLPDGFGQ